MIDKVVRQDDESARKGRRDVADDDDGKDQNQSPEVAYQRHKLSAEAHDGRRDDGVQPPVAQEVVEGVPGVFQTALFLHHQLQEDDDVKAQQKVDGLPCDGLSAQEQQSLCDRDLEQKDGAEDARRHGKVERIFQPDDHHNDAENQTKLRNFHCFSSSRSLL